MESSPTVYSNVILGVFIQLCLPLWVGIGNLESPQWVVIGESTPWLCLSEGLDLIVTKALKLTDMAWFVYCELVLRSWKWVFLWFLCKTLEGCEGYAF